VNATFRGLEWFAIAAALLTMALMAQSASAQPAGTAASTMPAQASEEVKDAWPPGLLMDLLGKAGLREPMDDAGVRVYGFVQSGFTGRLTGGQDPLAFRGFDARRPNNLRLHQLFLTAERVYDADKSFDLGAKLSGYYGGDAMLTHARGLFEHAGSGGGDNWADLFEVYVQGWFKTGPQSGLELTIGKWGTPMGYEATEAAKAPLYSRSLTYNFSEAITHTGLKANYIWNEQFATFVAVVNGWDNFRDNNDAHSYMAGFSWVSSEKVGESARDALSMCVMAGPEQDDNVSDWRTVIDVVYSHWWNEKLNQALNVDIGFERAPGGDSASWHGVAHYLSYVFNDRFTGVWRAEWFHDGDGVRTGYAGNLFENTLGVNITPMPKDRVLRNLTLRPELRWDFACDGVFGGGREHQLTAGMDVVFKF
jgi:hypothetical protein